ncbi:hypothetical protein ACC693_38385, partial [Rhizobium ruizarguesonis]
LGAVAFCVDRLGDPEVDVRPAVAEAFLKGHHYPGIEAGTEGVRWLENCVRSAHAGSAWVEFE